MSTTQEDEDQRIPTGILYGIGTDAHGDIVASVVKANGAPLFSVTVSVSDDSVDGEARATAIAMSIVRAANHFDALVGAGRLVTAVMRNGLVDDLDLIAVRREAVKALRDVLDTIAKGA